MAKKKAKATSKKAKATKKKVTKKAVARGKKKIVKKAPKKTVKKAVRKGIKKAVTKAVAKPKLPRRTPQAAPPPAPAPAPVAPVTPPETPAPPAPGPSEGTTAEWGGEGEGGGGWRGPAVGELAPDFTLPDQSGTRHTLSQYRGRKVVLYFYPKDDTPGCTTEACGFRDALGSFSDRNAVVLGISPDPVASHQRFVQKYNLTFPLLADEGHVVAERYGVWGPKTRAGKTVMGIARTTFVIEEDGRVAHIFRNVRPEGHEQEVLSRL
jgi:peroxiredoxin Q/BCP